MDLLEFDYITSEAKDSFGRFTIEKRCPKIVDDILKHNSWLSKSSEKRLSHLKSDIPNHLIKPIDSVYNKRGWFEFFQNYEGEKAVDVPFFFFETYFYQLLLESIDYHTEHENDPFAKIKWDDLKLNWEKITHQATDLKKILTTKNNTNFEILLRLSLSGNSSDLSQLQHSQFESGPIDMLIQSKIEHVVNQLVHSEVIEIVLDNAFTELWYDLLLALYICNTEPTIKVKLHVKYNPTFVSDATKDDLNQLLNFALKDEKTRFIAERVYNYIENGSIEIVNSELYNAPIHYPEIGSFLFDKGSFIIFKGDANYRRLFEDRVIPATANTQSLVNRNLTPALLIRTLKSEIISGLSENLVSQLNNADPNWCTNGTRGIIQLIPNMLR